MTVFVLDSAALRDNKAFLFESAHRYFCPFLVMDSWKDFRSKAIAENAFAKGILRVVDPCPLSVSEVYHFLEKNGLSRRLNKADVCLLALALELKPRRKSLVVVTDNFSVQNVCKLKKIRCVGVSRGVAKKPGRFPKSAGKAKARKK